MALPIIALLRLRRPVLENAAKTILSFFLGPKNIERCGVCSLPQTESFGKLIRF
jgi:hypothetical protein